LSAARHKSALAANAIIVNVIRMIMRSFVIVFSCYCCGKHSR
jgi:hypothetical protein